MASEWFSSADSNKAGQRLTPTELRGFISSGGQADRGLGNKFRDRTVLCPFHRLEG